MKNMKKWEPMANADDPEDLYLDYQELGYACLYTKTGPETAPEATCIADLGMFPKNYALKGDFRKEFEAVADKGLAALLEEFYKHPDEIDEDGALLTEGV